MRTCGRAYIYASCGEGGWVQRRIYMLPALKRLIRIEDSAKEGTSPGEGFNPLSVIITLLTAVSASSMQSDRRKPSPPDTWWRKVSPPFR